MIIGVNFDEVPDKIEPIHAGIYDCFVNEIKIENVKNDETKQKLVIKMTIDQEGVPDNGRTYTDNMSLDYTKDFVKTRLKNFYHSCTGNRPGAGGFDFLDCIGKKCKVEFRRNVYQKDPLSPKMEVANVWQYIIPA